MPYTFGPRRFVEAWDDEAPGGETHADGNGRGAPSPGRRLPDRPVVPGERRYRDGDRVRHARWGDGIVVSSRKLSSSGRSTSPRTRSRQVVGSRFGIWK